MSWEQILSEDDFRLYRENIPLLEKQVIERFDHLYEAAVLAEMGADVFTVEIDKTVGNAANRILSRLGYKPDNTIRDPSCRDEAKRAYLCIRG